VSSLPAIPKGAIAAVAGLAMADLNPYVITFGQPATIDAPCNMISSERWYRFVNTKAADKVGITYDPVPFVPGLGADDFGHMILLSEDPTGVAYIGLNVQESFGPLNTLGLEAHSMRAAAPPAFSNPQVPQVEFPGYLDRLEKLVQHTKVFPIRANGYRAGTLCSKDKECMSGKCASETSFTFHRCVGIECNKDKECESGRCDSGVCIAKEGSCMPCDEDTDCAGAAGKCLLFKCSGSNGLMDDNCICKWDSDCDSGRCELFSTGGCEARLAVGVYCNEHSDCLSNFCSWRFHCENRSREVVLQEKQEKEHTEQVEEHTVVEAKEKIEKVKVKKQHKKFGLALLVIAVGASALYFGGKWLWRNRQGYEEVPTEYNV
jgi:hypothetical protein